jgi:GDP-L-fucose synthase
MNFNDRIFVTGADGLLGRAVYAILTREGYTRVGALGRSLRHSGWDLRQMADVNAIMREYDPQHIIHCAARVGGIAFNVANPVGMFSDNMQMTLNIISGAEGRSVESIVLPGSSCAYPKAARQPMRESDLGTGPLEVTNEGYALAKLSSIYLARALGRTSSTRVYCPIFANLYGPRDTYSTEKGHVIPSLIRRFILAEAHAITDLNLWGTGTARREFLHAGDAAMAILALLNRTDREDVSHGQPVNVGSGDEVTIAELAAKIEGATGYRGTIHWDPSKPDGMPRKLLDSSTIRSLGWTPRVPLDEGIRFSVEECKMRLNEEGEL